MFFLIVLRSVTLKPEETRGVQGHNRAWFFCVSQTLNMTLYYLKINRRAECQR